MPPMPDRRAWLAVVASAADAAIAIGVMEFLPTRVAIPVMAIPFGTSIVLVLGSSEVEAAQPRALIGGHLISTLVGLLVVTVTGPQPCAAALAVGLAIAMHAPAPFILRPASIRCWSSSTRCRGAS
jgi:CBS-domain-containing membrane protein